MKILILVICAPILLLILYVIYRMRIGHLVALHLYRFETIYDSVFQETQSIEKALSQSLPIFSGCPILNRLRQEDYERIVEILKKSPFPKKIIQSIVMGFDAKTILRSLQDTDFLSKMARVGKEA
jgi:hypothetical protein